MTIEHVDETKIPPPKNPLTIRINLAILRYVRTMFFSKWLPGFQPAVSSDVRTAERNAKVGGAANSAHVHGLAEDFQLKDLAGKVIPEPQAKALFEQFIKPNWPGFSMWEASSPGEGYHVHVQLNRNISTYAGVVSLAGMGAMGIYILNKVGGAGNG
jgi:hypothetical protein